MEPWSSYNTVSLAYTHLKPAFPGLGVGPPGYRFRETSQLEGVSGYLTLQGLGRAFCHPARIHPAPHPTRAPCLLI